MTKLHELVENGGQIHYEPLGGGMLLLDHRGVDVTDSGRSSYTLNDFLTLRRTNVLQCVGYIKPHHRLHGKVYVYRKHTGVEVDEDQNLLMS